MTPLIRAHRRRLAYEAHARSGQRAVEVAVAICLIAAIVVILIWGIAL